MESNGSDENIDKKINCCICYQDPKEITNVSIQCESCSEGFVCGQCVDMFLQFHSVCPTCRGQIKYNGLIVQQPELEDTSDYDSDVTQIYFDQEDDNESIEECDLSESLESINIYQTISQPLLTQQINSIFYYGEYCIDFDLCYILENWVVKYNVYIQNNSQIPLVKDWIDMIIRRVLFNSITSQVITQYDDINENIIWGGVCEFGTVLGWDYQANTEIQNQQFQENQFKLTINTDFNQQFNHQV